MSERTICLLKNSDSDTGTAEFGQIQPVPDRSVHVLLSEEESPCLLIDFLKIFF